MIAAAGCSQEAAPVAVQQHPQAPDHEQEQLTAKSTFNMTLRFRITAQRERGEAVDRPELVSPRTRRAFREHLVAWPLRAIEDLFENEGLQPRPGSPAVTGQRCSLVERHYAAVDWSSPTTCAECCEPMSTSSPTRSCRSRPMGNSHVTCNGTGAP